MDKEDIKIQIFELVKKYYELNWPEREFIPGSTYINYAGRVFDSDELINLVDSSLEFWLTQGRYASEFEKEFSHFLGRKFTILCNSGSSANLLALSALTSHKLSEKRLVKGDEVITLAAGFPTTVNPIIQCGMIPVFVDIDIGSYNININALENAVNKKTRAVFLAHSLGNPFNIDAVVEICRQNNLWLIEDNCDALGSRYDGHFTGTFGDLSTFSFYPAHHITMGEGGCITTDDQKLKTIVESFRDWGRDCWCEPGKDNSCSKRFNWQLGNLPYGYDHKYTYSHIGYNLKMTDLQASIGVAQLKKLNAFCESRKENWAFLYDGLSQFRNYFILPGKEIKSDPSWFGFMLTIKEDAPFNRREIIDFLESKKIATRLLFGGNITRQPAYLNVDYRISGELINSDIVMTRSFWIGVYPGITKDVLNYIISCFKQFCLLEGNEQS
jgi:CDP-6-deoxy-D-xylo-4-hexulose-3-dehydrase